MIVRPGGHFHHDRVAFLSAALIIRVDKNVERNELTVGHHKAEISAPLVPTYKAVGGMLQNLFDGPFQSFAIPSAKLHDDFVTLHGLHGAFSGHIHILLELLANDKSCTTSGQIDIALVGFGWF